ncbi:hypothetical protein VPH35_086806 [Triticum aestivum]
MGDVRIMSRRMVRPKSSTFRSPERQPGTIHLTPWDLRMLIVDYNQKGVLLPKPPAAVAQGVVDRLASSLARALGRFFPLAGRLAVNDHGDSAGQTISLCYSDEGAEFVHAVAPGVTVADVTALLCIPRVVTELDDGVFVAMSLNHGGADGTTFWHLFNTWSEISRRSVDGGYDCEISSPLPVFDRWFPDGCAVPIPVPLGKLDDIVGLRRRAYAQRPPGQECFLRFSGESVKELVSKANAEMSGSGATISSLQAVLAHLWRAVCRAWRLAPEEGTRYVIQVGCRGRVDGVTAAYSGNAVSLAAADSTAGEVLEKGLGRAAWLLNRAGGARDLGPGASFGMPPALARGAGARALLVTGNCPRFNVYGNDFGWGAPVAVRSGAGNKVSHKATAYEGGCGAGSIALEVCLAPDALARLVADHEFMSATVP